MVTFSTCEFCGETTDNVSVSVSGDLNSARACGLCRAEMANDDCLCSDYGPLCRACSARFAAASDVYGCIGCDQPLSACDCDGE